VSWLLVVEASCRILPFLHGTECWRLPPGLLKRLDHVPIHFICGSVATADVRSVSLPGLADRCVKPSSCELIASRGSAAWVPSMEVY
jgi:hypothetical protein